MFHTRTGNFPIGFRRTGWDWMKDTHALAQWASDNGFAAIDANKDADESGQAVLDAGLRLGSVDLLEWQGMIDADAGKRSEAISRNTAYIEACARYGPVNHFLVMLPADPSLAPAENFRHMVAGFSALASALEKAQARVVIEGWPGPGALCCTPETVRAFFKECPSPVFGLNYDPSHLIRMGIDPIRFLAEFADRVHHVHGKDCALSPEGLYEFGNQLPAVWADKPKFGAWHWRYAIPGHGLMRWTKAFEMLANAGYRGCVSVELEDASFADDEESQKAGFLNAARILASY